MTQDAGGPVSLGLARALAGQGLEGSPPVPPLGWSLDGSRLGTRTLRAMRRVSRGPWSLPASFADRTAATLGARPLRWMALAAIAVPVLRLTVPAPLVVPACILLAVAASLSILLAAASALHEGRERVLVARALLAGLVLRAVLGATIQWRGGFPDEYGYYDPIARDSAACWQAGGPSLLATHPIVESRAAYFYILSTAYFLLDASMVVGRAAGAMLGLLAALLAGEIARPMGGPRAAALAVVVLALHPEHAFWSTTLSRDTLSAILVLLALAAMLRRPGFLLRGNLLAVAAPLGLLAMNSFLAAGALAATVVLILLAEAAVGGGSPAARAIRPALALLLGGAALALVGHRYGNLFTPELFSAVRSQAIGAVPDFFPDLQFHSLGQVALFLPVGSVFVLIAPWPWEAVHPHRALYGLLASIGLVVTLAGLVGLGVAVRRRAGAAAPPVLFLLLFLGLLAVLEGTSGIVSRHRLPLTALLSSGAGVLLAGMRGPDER